MGREADEKGIGDEAAVDLGSRVSCCPILLCDIWERKIELTHSTIWVWVHDRVIEPLTGAYRQCLAETMSLGEMIQLELAQ